MTKGAGSAQKVRIPSMPARIWRREPDRSAPDRAARAVASSSRGERGGKRGRRRSAAAQGRSGRRVISGGRRASATTTDSLFLASAIRGAPVTDVPEDHWREVSVRWGNAHFRTKLSYTYKVRQIWPWQL